MSKEPITEHILVKIIVKYPKEETGYECQFDIDSMFDKGVVSQVVRGHLTNIFKSSDGWLEVKKITQWDDGKLINTKEGI